MRARTKSPYPITVLYVTAFQNTSTCGPFWWACVNLGSIGVCVVTVDCAVKAPILQCSTAVSVWTNCGAARSQNANSTAGHGPIAFRLSLGAVAHATCCYSFL